MATSSARGLRAGLEYPADYVYKRWPLQELRPKGNVDKPLEERGTSGKEEVQNAHRDH